VDSSTGMPLNQEVLASSNGAVITITAAQFGPGFTLTCAVSAGATETYLAGVLAPASQTATLSGVIPVNESVVTAINSVSVSYTVAATDATPAALAASVTAAINATETVDSFTNRPLNKLIQASSSGGDITIATVSPGAPLTLACSLAIFQTVLEDVLNFARVKAAISPNDEQLLAVVETPTLMSADGSTYQLVKLTGWALSSLNSLLQSFFGTTQLSSLFSIERLRRVFDAFTYVTSCRVSAASLLAATTNAPTAATVASLQSALRALYAASDWLNVIKPINDALRIQQRDALVAYILQQLGDQYANSTVTLQTSGTSSAGSTILTFASTAELQAGMGVQGLNIPANVTVTSLTPTAVTLSTGISADLPTGSSLLFTPTGVPAISTANDLYEYFLVDVETQPPVQTSRIRLALSSIQLFIERVLRNLEPHCLPTDINGSLWTWMKRYRVWQANREVFLWPENWLYPELRDDQSPIFQQMMSALQQSDITDEAAAAAYLDYLSNLELVAKLEPCGLYYVPATGDADEAAYAIARTAGAHRKYYFREFQYESWTPWTEIQIDCEDMPIVPVVWQGRLLLFWLKLNKATTPQAAPSSTSLTGNNNLTTTATQLSLQDFQLFAAAAEQAQTQGNVTINAVLCWSEYYNGKWQPQKSSDVNSPAMLQTPLGIGFDTAGSKSFDVIRNLVTIQPASVAVAESLFFGNLTIEFPVQNALPSDALILAIIAPGAIGGFVMYNTHSLPVRWDDIQLTITFPVSGSTVGNVPLIGLIPTPTPGRTFYPGGVYTGGSVSGTFNISYWTVTSPGTVPSYTTTSYQNSLFGLNRQPRIVDAAPNGAGWNSPFFFEDRRNVFYVTTTESYVPFFEVPIYGIVSINAFSASSSPVIPQLILDTPPDVLKPTAFATGFFGGHDGTLAVSQFVTQNGAIHAALGSTAPVVYQNMTLYPTGQASEQATISQALGVSAAKTSP
jgi:Neuraminidase-like domain